MVKLQRGALGVLGFRGLQGAVALHAQVNGCRSAEALP